ncbi:MAG: hypothetical protein ACE5KZ_09650 [Candidatus Scalinduaceae bacterium]
MGRAIIYYSYIQILNDSKITLWLAEWVRTFFTVVCNRIKTTFLLIRDWCEDRNSHYSTVNTHHYGTKILLINALHNR